MSPGNSATVHGTHGAFNALRMTLKDSQITQIYNLFPPLKKGTKIALLCIALLVITAAVVPASIITTRIADKGDARSNSTTSDPNAPTSGGTPSTPQPRDTSHGNETGHFLTTTYRTWDQPQPLFSQFVRFPTAFPTDAATGMSIALGLTVLNIQPGGSQIGFSVYTASHAPDGFMLHMDATSDTRAFYIHADWLAVPGYIATNTTQYQAGQFTTLSSHPSSTAQQTTSARISFPYAFSSPPRIVCWINGLLMSSSRDWRLKTYASDITPDAFTIHVDAWNDTLLYVGNVSWLAFPSDARNVLTGDLKTGKELYLIPNTTPTQDAYGGTVGAEWPVEIRTGNVPTVLSGVSEFDIDNNSHLRISSEYDGGPNVTAEGISMIIGAGSGTRFREGTMTYISVF